MISNINQHHHIKSRNSPAGLRVEKIGGTAFVSCLSTCKLLETTSRLADLQLDLVSEFYIFSWACFFFYLIAGAAWIKQVTGVCRDHLKRLAGISRLGKAALLSTKVESFAQKIFMFSTILNLVEAAVEGFPATISKQPPLTWDVQITWALRSVTQFIRSFLNTFPAYCWCLPFLIQSPATHLITVSLPWSAAK